MQIGPRIRKKRCTSFSSITAGWRLRRPVFSRALRCIRCGACANVCPIYKLVGGHNYGHVYIGAIGLMLTYFYHGRRNARAIVKNCLNCQACKAVCPTVIDLPYLIKEVHRTILNVEGKKPLRNLLLKSRRQSRCPQGC